MYYMGELCHKYNHCVAIHKSYLSQRLLHAIESEELRKQSCHEAFVICDEENASTTDLIAQFL